MSNISPERRDSKPIVISINNVAPRAEDPESVSQRLLGTPVTIHLFTDRPDRVFDPNNLGQFLETTLGPNFKVEQHGDLIKQAQTTLSLSEDTIASTFTQAKCSARFDYSYLDRLSEADRLALEKETLSYDPSTPFREIAEIQSSSWQKKHRLGWLFRNYDYEVPELGNAYRSLLPEEFHQFHDGRRRVSLIITGRGIGNLEGPNNRAFHMRGGYATGSIGVVSTTGLVEAPSKPIEYEEALKTDFPPMEIIRIAKQKFGGLNGDILVKILNDMYKDRILLYEDQRLNQAVRGLALSFVLFGLGEAGKASFCSTTDLQRQAPDLSKFCRLHDGHWQEEVIRTQVKKPEDAEFCDYHQAIFTRLQNYKQS